MGEVQGEASPNMEAQRRVLDAFLALRASESHATDEPTAYLQFCSPDGAPPSTSAPLLTFTSEDVVAALDTDSELVRWLLNQMRTYDCTRQRIVGLIFDRRTVLTEVLWTACE